VTEAAVGTPQIGAKEFAWLSRFLFDRTGIELKPGKESMVMGRLDRRLRHHGLSSYGQYLQLLDGDADPDEVRVAVDLLTTNETYFFREPAHFDFLADLMTNRAPGLPPVRVWSAACSSGEEPYTISLVLESTLPSGHQWEVLATDISTRVLDRAARGLYPLDAAEKIPKPLLREYCLRGRDDFAGYFTLDRSLRARVKFRQLNLMEVPDLGTFDVIFLRNVMIYFGQETKQRLVNRMEQLLRPDGYFIVSHAETLNGIRHGMTMVTPSVYRAGARGA